MRSHLLTAAAVTLVLGAAGCGFLDITDVENPRTTDDDLANAARPTEALLPGVRAQFARALGAVVTVTENVSDNYSIQGTGLGGKELDAPTAIHAGLGNINGTGGTGIYWNLQELRALADFVFAIVPGDTSATPEQIAELHLYRGLAFLMQGENFIALPLERDGAPVAADSLVRLAITELIAGQTADPGGVFDTPLHAALARAYRMADDPGQAEAHALAALAADPAFAYVQEYDAVNLNNNPYVFLVLRALQEMQPLPRLDFLDPKYTTRESGIAFAKAEEMHLILAEVEFTRGNWGVGRDHVVDAITLALTSGRIPFDDIDLRRNADLSIRPRTDTIEVRADATSPYVLGLVLDRPGPILTPPISWTSLDPAAVAAISPTQIDSILHAFHQARQEIMFLEGRRMSDLGIRLPMMQREIDANGSIDPGDPGTEAFVPGWIPGLDSMDLYTPAVIYDASDPVNPILLVDQVTILFDMNQRLATTRYSPFTMP